MDQKPKPVVKPKHVAARELAEKLYINSVARVVEIIESKPGAASDVSEVKKMLHRRYGLAVEAAEIFMTQWQANGKGRFVDNKE